MKVIESQLAKTLRFILKLVVNDERKSKREK